MTNSPAPIHQLDGNGSPLDMTLENMQQAVIALNAAKGDLIRLSLSTKGGAFDVSLQNGEGDHVRQFLEQGDGRKHIVFVAETARSQLLIHANEQGSIQISQTGHIQRDDQVAPKKQLLSPRLSKLAQYLDQGGDSSDFWKEIETTGTPMVEAAEGDNKILTFLARGAKENVKLLGGPTNDHYSLTRLGTSDIWFRSMIVPKGTLFSYQLAMDVPDFDGPARLRRTAILAKTKADPFNKHPWPAIAPDAYNQHSTLRLEGGDLTIWHDERGSPEGSLSHHLIKSPELGNERDIWIYKSSNLDASDPDTPLLFVFDGERFLSSGATQKMLDNLVAEGVIPPLVAVFISPIDLKIRGEELPDSDEFAEFMAKTLHSFVVTQTGLKPKASRTILAGASYGGLGSTTIALKYPDLFGNSLSMSGSYWWSPDRADMADNYVARNVASQPKKPVRFFLATGQFETARGAGFSGIQIPNRHLRDVLVAKNYDVTLREYPAAHDMFAWREILAQGLIALIGKHKI